MHIKYRNKKMATNSKGAPKDLHDSVGISLSTPVGGLIHSLDKFSSSEMYSIVAQLHYHTLSEETAHSTEYHHLNQQSSCIMTAQRSLR